MSHPSPLVLDSVTHLTEAHRGAVAYCASHGARYAAYYAAAKGIAGLILNDAGIGRERVGFAGPLYLERLGVPAATVSSTSARIGDGRDGHDNGVLSFVNDPARERGLEVGMQAGEALARLLRSPLPPSPAPPPEAEHRREIAEAGRGSLKVLVLDSNGLVGPADAGHIIVTGSHGGLLGGKPETAIKHPASAAIYNDAGFGKDAAGISRLPALEARGVAGACVSHFSARIGDGMSTFNNGFISALNQAAARRGGLIGQSCREFVAAMVATAQG